MFGHQDHEDHQENNNDDASAPVTTAPVDDQVSEQIDQLSNGTNDDGGGTTPTIGSDAAMQPPATADDKPSDGTAGEAAYKEVLSPAGGYPQAPHLKVHAGGSSKDVSTNDLVDIKQHALDELSPLIDDLDQTPDERFRTLMMMIQASDNQSLIKTAYEAAHNITDEKSRAQALLDIINEINYFTQQPTDK